MTEFHRGEEAEDIVRQCPFLYWPEHWPKKDHLFWGGTGCGPGWWPMLKKLSTDIERIIEKHIKDNEIEVTKYQKEGADPPWPYVVQIKEKFGGLRFYVSTAGMRIDIMGSGKIHSFKDKEDEKDPWHEVGQLIAEAEAKSCEICENCGKPGNRYSRKKLGWIKTLCDDCPEVKRQVGTVIHDDDPE